MPTPVPCTSQVGFLSTAMSSLHLLAPLAHLPPSSPPAAPGRPPHSASSSSSSSYPSGVAVGAVIDDRALLLRVLGWLLDLDPAGAMAPQSPSAPSDPSSPTPLSLTAVEGGAAASAAGSPSHASGAVKTAASFAVEAYVCCLRMPGREALRLRTMAMQLLPDILLGLTAHLSKSLAMDNGLLPQV